MRQCLVGTPSLVRWGICLLERYSRKMVQLERYSHKMWQLGTPISEDGATPLS
nr:hypothetical protein Q903MT_gene1715 [Picea sitchensis]